MGAVALVRSEAVRSGPVALAAQQRALVTLTGTVASDPRRIEECLLLRAVGLGHVARGSGLGHVVLPRMAVRTPSILPLPRSPG